MSTGQRHDFRGTSSHAGSRRSACRGDCSLSFDALHAFVAFRGKFVLWPLDPPNLRLTDFTDQGSSTLCDTRLLLPTRLWQARDWASLESCQTPFTSTHCCGTKASPFSFAQAWIPRTGLRQRRSMVANAPSRIMHAWKARCQRRGCRHRSVTGGCAVLRVPRRAQSTSDRGQGRPQSFHISFFIENERGR